MLSSLPPLFPHDPHALWYPSLTTNQPPPTTDHHSHNHITNDPPSHPHHTPNHQQQQQNRAQTPQRTLLSILCADENATLNRKANIRRFGAGWLRPPGVGKTLQGMADERAEREEVEGVRAREMALAEAQAAAEAEAEEGMGEEVVGERDLDEDVPEGEAEGEDVWSDDDGEGSEGELDADVVEEGTIEGFEEGEGDFVDEGAVEVDLDEAVPEGEEGSYEHTDTEVEDESSGDEDVGRRGPPVGSWDRRTGEVVRVSAGGREALGSSPLMGGRARGNGRGN